MDLIINRKKKFASAAVPFFIILSNSKEEFLIKHRLPKDNNCELTWQGHAIPRADFDPSEYGIPIKNGETLELEILEEINSVFAMTYEGLLSNEIVLDNSQKSAQITITAKGGWSKPSYPVLVQEY